MKRLLALILAVFMMATLFVGCEDAVVEEEEYYNLQFDAFYEDDEHDNEMRYFTVTENFDGEVEVEYNNIAYVVSPGVTVKEALTENYVTDIDIVDEDGKFLGWMKYGYESEIDEFGNDFGTFYRADDKLYTTEEILEFEISGTFQFVAKWSDISDDYYAEMGY